MGKSTHTSFWGRRTTTASRPSSSTGTTHTARQVVLPTSHGSTPQRATTPARMSPARMSTGTGSEAGRTRTRSTPAASKLSGVEARRPSTLPRQTTPRSRGKEGALIAPSTQQVLPSSRRKWNETETRISYRAGRCWSKGGLFGQKHQPTPPTGLRGRSAGPPLSLSHTHTLTHSPTLCLSAAGTGDAGSTRGFFFSFITPKPTVE